MTVPAQLRPAESRTLAHSSMKVACDVTQRLPVEILSCVLDYLYQPDVLCAARVSRRWRAISRTHRHYYAHICFKNSMSAPWSANWELHVAQFCNKLRRCRKRGVRMSLCVTVVNDAYGWLTGLAPNAVGQWTHWMPDTEPVRDLYLERVLPAIRDSLDSVVKLVLEGDVAYVTHMYSALRTPAPKLEFLELACMDNVDDVAAPPADLFACDAPRLRDVRMFGFSLPSQPVVAFQRARRVTLCFIDQPPLSRIMDIFRAPVSLDISCGNAEGMLPAAQSQVVSFGPNLRTLRLDISPDDRWPADIFLAVEKHNVAAIEYDLSGPDLHLKQLLHNYPSSLNLLYDKEGDDPEGPVMIHVDDGHKYRRTFHIKKGDPWDMTRQLDCIHSHVVFVDILHAYIQDFLREIHQLPVLTTLRIDVRGYHEDYERLGNGAFWATAYACYGDEDYIYLRDEPIHCSADHWDPETGWGPALDTLDRFDPDFAAECPQLRDFELYDGDGEAIVDRRELVHLARDFSLLRSAPSAKLFLNGVEVIGPPHMGMSMIFSDFYVT
ncbi:hypothetical protein AURDEDRAFT_163105 [Auricularia subglabra TFB-10046 SS5]|nr:hypothetical protein AURDEDRAFT_163105 [Auricularia subglabra TFB-10046 SS5]